MSVQAPQTFTTASAAHAALRAAGAEIAQLGPRLTTGLKTLARDIDVFIPPAARDDVARDTNAAITSIEEKLTLIAAVVAFGEEYYAHVALHGGAAAFIAHVDEALPHLTQHADDLEHGLSQVESQSQTVGFLAKVHDGVALAKLQDVQSGHERVVGTLAAKTIEHLRKSADSDPALASKLAQVDERSAAELKDFAAKLIASRTQGVGKQ